MKLEELIQKHRPPAAHENDPCGQGQLWHLNRHKLLWKAIRRQMERDGIDVQAFVDAPPRPGRADKPAVVISRLTAWEILAEAQRNGLRLLPHRPDPDAPPGRRDASADDDEHGAFLGPPNQG